VDQPERRSGHSVGSTPPRWVLLLLGLAGCAALTLPPNRPLARSVLFRGAYEEFPSGLRLVVHEDPQASRVTMDVSYRVGATDEPAGKEGLAHLVEHLSFLSRPGGERAPRLSSRLLASGTLSNAFTSYDGTDYFLTAPPEPGAPGPPTGLLGEIPGGHRGGDARGGAALVKRLSLGAEVIVILGDAAALRPQFEGAGFQVEVLERPEATGHVPEN
jgi:hypothetical protein